MTSAMTKARSCERYGYDFGVCHKVVHGCAFGRERISRYQPDGRSAAVKSVPRASLALTEGRVPSRASKGQEMLRVGSFQRIERSPAG